MAETLTSFWDLLIHQPVVVPIIQRDYAQGREGQSTLRRRFLKSLFDALSAKDEASLILDFVYGANKNKKFQPIDGQQRLTTLWLLHWYVALKAGALKEEKVSETLSKFSYETRVSSREFCEQLCRSDHFKDQEAINHQGIVQFITNQTWFYKGWFQDPTISGMLRMLGSSKKKSESAADQTNQPLKAADNLEDLLSKSTDFMGYWDELTSNSCPIRFYYVSMNDYGLYDDLYIKINARGKQLTSYENFKADLIGFIEKQKNNDLNWKELSDPHNGLAQRMDSEWTDLFWKNRDEKHSIDEVYFAFLNRFFTNELILNSTTKDKKDEDEIESLTNYFPSPYLGLEPYRLHNSSHEALNKLVRVMDNFISTLKKAENQNNLKKPNELIEAWTGEKFEFIPDPQKGTTSFTLLDQIQFFAICKYFSEGQGDESSFKRWMRVVKNLIVGKDLSGRAVIRSIDAVKSAIGSLQDLKSHTIYENLSGLDLLQPSKSGDFRDWDSRLNEEILKAKQILDSNFESLREKTLGETWEEAIIRAEKYSFFEGSICFLFQDENGDVNWNDFDKKWLWVQKHFKDEEWKSSDLKNSVLKEPFNEDALLLKALMSRFDSNQFRSVAYWNYRTFNNHANTWRYLLRNRKITGPVHQLLMSGDKPEVVINYRDSSDFYEKIIHQLTADKQSNSDNKTLLDFVVEEIPSSWVRTTWRNHLSIYPSAKGVFLDAKNRDWFIASGLEKDEIELIDKNQQIRNTTYLYGAEVGFVYNNRKFTWDEDNFIYLLESVTEDTLVKKVRDETKKEPHERYYRINTQKSKDEPKTFDEIFEQLDKIDAP